MRCEKLFKANEMESVPQSITGSGIVYFPPAHHLLYLTVTIILSVLLSYTFHFSVSHGPFNTVQVYVSVCADTDVLDAKFCPFFARFAFFFFFKANLLFYNHSHTVKHRHTHVNVNILPFI